MHKRLTMLGLIRLLIARKYAWNRYYRLIRMQRDIIQLNTQFGCYEGPYDPMNYWRMKDRAVEKATSKIYNIIKQKLY